MAYIGQSLTEGTRRVYTYVATASQTTFNAVYGVGAVDVYQNGILLAPADYTASDGTTVVLGVGAAFQDEITIVCHNTFSVADTVSASQGGTFNGPVTIDGNGATVLTVDRATSDGTIIDVQKNGTTVGSIGVANTGNASFLYVGFGDTGLSFQGNTNDAITPVNTAGSNRDNAIDLGSTTSRFKDLYLSGGVYLGGIGAANKLDDYETGTWTPAFSNAFLEGAFNNATGFTDASGRYVRIGEFVQCWAEFKIAGASGDLVGDDNFSFTKASLPFVPTSATHFHHLQGTVTAYSAVGSGSNASGTLIHLETQPVIVAQITAITNTVSSVGAEYGLGFSYRTIA